MAIVVERYVDRARALSHFGDEAVMNSLMMRFPDTVQATMQRFRRAWEERRAEDVLCHIYQMRGAASWICADQLLRACDEVQAKYREGGCGDNLAGAINHLEMELELTCRAVWLTLGEGQGEGQEPADLPADLTSLAQRLLHRQADQRPTGSELAQQFEVQSIPRAAASEALVCDSPIKVASNGPNVNQLSVRCIGVRNHWAIDS